jgi:hypothetical protein
MVGWRATLGAFGAINAAAACALDVNGLGPAELGLGDAASGVDVAVDAAGDVALGDDVTPDTTGVSGDGPLPTEDGGADVAAPESGVVAGGPSLCATANVLFCDGFENGLGAWTAEANGGHSSPDKARAFRGSSSLHATVDAVKQPNGPVNAKQVHFQQLPADVFVRVFLYVPSPFPPANPDLIEITVDNAPYPGMEVRGQTPGHLAATAFGGPTDDWTSASLLPLDQWTCLEVEVDGPNQAFRAWMNDAAIADMTRSFTQPVSTAGIVKVGLAYFGPAANQAPTEVWVDEVAVDGARIGGAK